MSTVTEQLAALIQIKANIREAINAKGVTVTEADPFYIYASKILEIGGGESTPPTYSPYRTIAEQLTTLNQIKIDIRNAIISKGVSVPVDTPFADYADKILEINLTATGNPVSIITSKAQNAISTILSFSPKQSGSGTPSPQNIRPIEGWTEYDLTVNENRITESLGGTYYGFTVDLENGTATVTHIAEVYDGTEASWDINITGNGYYIPISNGSGYDGEKPLICSCLYGMNAGSSFGMPQNAIRINGGKTNLLVKVDTEADFPTVDSWKQFLQSNPMTVLFPIAEPITLTLTPQTVTLLKGNNTLWTDGDSITITYI